LRPSHSAVPAALFHQVARRHTSTFINLSDRVVHAVGPHARSSRPPSKTTVASRVGSTCCTPVRLLQTPPNVAPTSDGKCASRRTQRSDSFHEISSTRGTSSSSAYNICILLEKVNSAVPGIRCFTGDHAHIRVYFGSMTTVSTSVIATVRPVRAHTSSTTSTRCL
jgi:hypothetical protein